MRDINFARRREIEAFKILNDGHTFDFDSINLTEMTTKNDKISTVKYNQIVNYYKNKY